MAAAELYMAWFDDDKHKSVGDKLVEAADAFENRWGKTPTIVKMNPADVDALGGVLTFGGMEVVMSDLVRPNTFQVGRGFENAHQHGQLKLEI